MKLNAADYSVQMDKLPSTYNGIDLKKKSDFYCGNKYTSCKQTNIGLLKKDWGISKWENIRNIVNLMGKTKIQISRGKNCESNNKTIMNSYEDILVE